MHTMEEPSPLVVGQVLKRPLYHPLTGKILVAAGIVLSPTVIERLRRLSLLEVAIKCRASDRSPKATVAPTNPEGLTAEIREQAYRLEEELVRGLMFPLDGVATREYLGPAMSMIEALILRLKQAKPDPGCDLRIYGGGEFTHPINVLLLSTIMGLQLGLTWEKLVALGQAALLHDVGKRRVNLQRLGGRMSDYGQGVMERHPEHGVEIVKQLKRFVPQIQEDVLLGIHAHHERWDGRGYPMGWKGEAIPLIARILSVADVYEIMTADQLYWPRKLSGEAYREILTMADRAFDPKVIAAFCQVVTPYPNQAIVQLSNGQVCRVLRQGRDALHPVVQIGEEGELELGQPGGPSIERHYLPRRHPRRSRDLPVTLRDTATDVTNEGRTLDLSMGGACVRMRQAPARGAHVLLKVGGLGSQELVLQANVVWVSEDASGFRLGLNFPVLPSHLWASWHDVLQGDATLTSDLRANWTRWRA